MPDKKYTTSDIGLASYIMLKGGKLLSTGRGRQGYEIVFDDLDGKCGLLAVEYLNSEFTKYDMYSKNLRLLLKNQI
tara:strand:- start:120 stop:347 length:228 start_codon:yes stop_codon:yes gene_type:complete